MRYAQLDPSLDGERLAIVLDEYAFCEDDHGRLVATREHGGRLELLEAEDGRLVLRERWAAAPPILN